MLVLLSFHRECVHILDFLGVISTITLNGADKRTAALSAINIKSGYQHLSLIILLREKTRKMIPGGETEELVKPP